MKYPLAVAILCSLVLQPVSARQDVARAVAVTAAASTPVQRFLLRVEEPVTSYRALRRLEAHNKRYKKHGWIEAWATLDPVAGFSFEIVGEGGSSYVRDRVLRKALEREREAYQQLEMRTAALTPVNYEFSGEATTEDGLTAVSMVPRRRDSLLVNGRLCLSDEADLVRVEGQLAKNPSMWTKRVEVVKRYGRVGGYRMPLTTESTAQVMLAGESSFLMRYEYASINGVTVGDPRPRGAAAFAVTEK